MKLYTRSGDDGTTGLFGGERVRKDDPRVEAGGCVDELNAAVGFAAAALGAPLREVHARSSKPQALAAAASDLGGSGEFQPSAAAILTDLQLRLFDLGADLATPLGDRHEQKVARIAAEDVSLAERWIDHVDAGNDRLTQFVLPGGCELASRLHLARTSCRRAERAMVRLSAAAPVNPHAIVFINRISDLLFALARRANKAAGVPDVLWTARPRPQLQRPET